MKKGSFCALAALLLLAPISQAAIIGPLASFGGGDGWLAPNEGGYTFLGTANNERGLAYGNGHVYLVSRSGGTNVRILDPLTAADLGGLNVTGVSGGTFAVNAAAASNDGSIYVGNLTTGMSGTAPYKLYKWANEAAAPITAINTGTLLPGSRLGDDLALVDTGGTTLLAAGYGSTPAVAGNNSYAKMDMAPSVASNVTFPGTPPAAGDFRLGITFADSSHVVGTQTGGTYRYTSFAGTAGTLVGSGTVSSTTERLMAVAIISGTTILAEQSTTDSHVSIYDFSNPLAPILMGTANNTNTISGPLVANANGAGQLAWGPITGDTATLYAMSTNQGIQAFIVTVPEPVFVLPVGFALLLVRRARKNRN